MNSRMDKYNNNGDSDKVFKRNLQNKDKYEHTMHDISEVNCNLEDNVVYINSEEQLQMVLSDENAFNKLKKLNDKTTENKIIEKEEELEESKDYEEHTIYDINLFLNSASSNKDKYVSGIKSENLIDDTLDLYQTDTFFTKHVINKEKVEIKEESSNIKQIIPKNSNNLNEDLVYEPDNNDDKKKLESLVEHEESRNLIDETNVGSKTNRINKEIINTQVLSPIELSDVSKFNNVDKSDHTFDLLSDLRASENTIVIPPQKVEGNSLMNTNGIDPTNKNLKVGNSYIVKEKEEVLDGTKNVGSKVEPTKIAEKMIVEEKTKLEKTNYDKDIKEEEEEEEDTFYDGTLSFDKKDFNAKNEKNKKMFVILAILLIIIIVVTVFIFVLMDAKV